MGRDEGAGSCGYAEHIRMKQVDSPKGLTVAIPRARPNHSRGVVVTQSRFPLTTYLQGTGFESSLTLTHIRSGSWTTPAAPIDS